jgi:hypothetical protein
LESRRYLRPKICFELKILQALLNERDQCPWWDIVDVDSTLVDEALVAKRKCGVRETCAFKECPPMIDASRVYHVYTVRSSNQKFGDMHCLTAILNTQWQCA